MAHLRPRLAAMARGLARGARAVLLLALLQAVPASGARADSLQPLADGWERYVNERYGMRFDFPADVFTAQPPPENGDGRRFTAPDATLEIYAFPNPDDDSAATLKRKLIGAEGYADVTYSPSGPGWLVLSGFRGDQIFYEKYFFQGDAVYGFGMEFPRSAKPRYAPILERIEDSFRSG